MFANFYHSLTRKYTIVFGNLFDNIVVKRLDGTNNTVKQFKVPLSYGPKMKFITMYYDSLRDEQIKISIPRIAFRVSDVSANKKRTNHKLNRNAVASVVDKDKVLFQYGPVAYDITFELSIIAKYEDDLFQIIEQILPYFNPSISQSIRLIDELDLHMDIITTLDGFSISDEQDSSMEDTRLVEATMIFKMQANYFGPVSSQGVIKRVQVDFHTQGDVEDRTTPTTSRIAITPGLTANGTPTNMANQSIAYALIDADDDYGIIENLDTFDGPVWYNPVTGKDTTEKKT